MEKHNHLKVYLLLKMVIFQGRRVISNLTFPELTSDLWLNLSCPSFKQWPERRPDTVDGSEIRRKRTSWGW